MTGVHEWTSDLVFVAGLAIVATAIVLRDPVPTPIRVGVVLPLLLFLPGYALLSVFFPDRPSDGGGPGGERRRSVDAIERVALSVALSIAVVPSVALVANFTTGIEARPIAIGVLGVTLVSAVLALVARLRTPAAVRFRLDGRSMVADLHDRSFTTSRRSLSDSGLFEAETGTQRLLNLVFVVALLTLAASVGFAAVGTESPANDATFTEYYLVGETENGTYSTAAVPTAFEPGESRTVYVGIENHEDRQVEYTTVVMLQRVAEDGSVQESTRIDEFSTTVAAGERERVARDIAPEMEGENLRLVFLLYQGEPPTDPNSENAYRETRLLITVGGGGESALAAPDDSQLTAPAN